MTCLGISIGTTRTGVCVLKDGVLLDRNIHNYQRIWTDDKLRTIINRYKQYILKYNITAIVVKIPPLKKHTKQISKLIKHIERLAKQYDCEFDLTTKKELKYVTGAGKTNEIIRYTLYLYPELKFDFRKGSLNDHKYYKKLFEAVLSAHIYTKRQLERAEQLK